MIPWESGGSGEGLPCSVALRGSVVGGIDTFEVGSLSPSFN